MKPFGLYSLKSIKEPTMPNKDRPMQEICQELLDQLNNTLDPKLFDALLGGDAFELKSIRDNKATFVCESASNATMIRSALLPQIKSILSKMLETDIDIEIVDHASYIRKNQAIEQAHTVFFQNCVLQSQFTFQSFVVGPSNRNAYTAGLFAISSPAKSNPIFLYSKSGLGKTHLLQAIGNEYQNRHPEAKVLYITSDDFLNEYVRYIKGRKAEELRDFFTTVDMLLVDDIQFLAGKSETQTMFFNVFNYLVSHNRQIIITSDRSPSELKDLPDRLVSRFAGGLTISISNPNKDTLIDILKMKIRIQGLDENMFSREVLDYLVFNYSTNVRELEGAFTTLLFNITTTKHPDIIDLEFVKTVFQVDEKKREKTGKVTIDTLIRDVSEYYSITESQLKSKSRISQIALARQIAMYLARNILNMTYQGIGKYFGKDHTTVMSNVQKIQQSIDEGDTTLKNAVDKLKETILAD